MPSGGKHHPHASFSAVCAAPDKKTLTTVKAPSKPDGAELGPIGACPVMPGAVCSINASPPDTVEDFFSPQEDDMPNVVRSLTNEVDKLKEAADQAGDEAD